MTNLGPTSQLEADASEVEKRVALIYRTLVLSAALWIVTHKGWPDQILDRKLVELSLRDLLGAVIGVAVACAVGGWLIMRLLNPPPYSLRTKSWCDGWIIWTNVPLSLVALAVFVVFFPTRSSAINGYAGQFLAEIVSLFI